MKLSLAPILCIIACIHPVFSFSSVPPPAKLLMPAEKNTLYGKDSARGSDEAGHAALREESILKQVETYAASFEANPAREEEQLGTMLDKISTDVFLRKLSTPELINEAQREKNSKEVSSIIRRTMESARVKATSLQEEIRVYGC
jgi:hypothetical protein